MSKKWIPVASVSDVWEGGTMRVTHEGEAICLYRLNGRLYATQDTCTHGAASLAEGYVDGDTIECPFHQGTFHIPTGRATGAPCSIDLRVYEVAVEGGHVVLGTDRDVP
jgi:nitrite reductase/ring-hydroxylating ferredoxin subunit